ncbi:Gfo/Idh/MocA family oxidoreductase [uncultured Algibacter sp.]|uniref:Gfo/Idh/MocA family protein n=1 Tax=uncultured Algibacter sp. TaxID=298659 RepID=UPI00261AAF55|nr:Gfo/Idh/MocA family oxidoreductase [uncultured Algibacter sp.]
MKGKRLNIGIIGYKFMGKAHSNAWAKVGQFFDLPATPVLKVACGRNLNNVTAFAEKWGWEEVETDWKQVVSRDDIDIIDIALPQHLHYEIAVEAAKHGKHIFCEKPIAMDVEQATEMYNVSEANGIVHYLNHNYRRVPAIALAKQLITDNVIGEIYHWRSAYQQDWITDPNFPLSWQLQEEYAKAGPHWDLNSHAVDLAHFLVGDIQDVMAMTTNFIKERPLANPDCVGSLKVEAISTEKGEVTVEDAALMMVNFKNGAVGSFEATRFANGRKNKLSFEVYGSKGSLTFNLERMNELEYYSEQDADGVKGFRTISVTEDVHPYVKHWWPAGHIIGYEHTFVHAAADFITAVSEAGSIAPNFKDGISIIEVLEAGLKSSLEKRVVSIK